MPQCTPLPYLAGTTIVLGLILGLWWLHDCVLRRQSQQLRLRMNDRLDARTRRNCESIDTLRQSVQGLILKVHGVAMRMPTQEPLRTVLNDALTQAEGIVWDDAESDCNPDLSGNARELASLLSAFSEKLAGWQGPECRVTVQGQPRALNAGVCADLFAVGREAMLNAFRHAHATEVLVQVAYRHHTLQLTVSDDGLGSTPEEWVTVRRVGRHGLDGMRERAEELGAILLVRARAGGGTEWRLTLPAVAAYAPSKNVLWCWWKR